jgi:hypothetical protein
MKRLREWWDARRRKIDIEILWPCCKTQAEDLDQARMAFACHAFYDPAWQSLGHNEIAKRIGELV